MREFFKYVFATVVGIIISTVLIFILFVILIVGIVASIDDDKPVDVASNSVLYLNLDQNIKERTPGKSFDNLPIVGSGGGKSIGFNDIIRALKRAKTDENIECIYLCFKFEPGVNTGYH